MTPEVDTQTKDNLETSRENKKKILSERQYSPAEQWDQVAFELIRQQLAPDGFKKIVGGVYRGASIAKSKGPGISIQQFKACQRAAAQMVRSFRYKAKTHVQARIKELDEWIKEDQKQLAACRFWEFGKKADLRYKIRSLHGQSGSAIGILRDLDNIGIK